LFGIGDEVAVAQRGTLRKPVVPPVYWKECGLAGKSPHGLFEHLYHGVVGIRIDLVGNVPAVVGELGSSGHRFLLSFSH
jgi:hypothetical protein